MVFVNVLCDTMHANIRGFDVKRLKLGGQCRYALVCSTCACLAHTQVGALQPESLIQVRAIFQYEFPYFATTIKSSEVIGVDLFRFFCIALHCTFDMVSYMASLSGMMVSHQEIQTAWCW